MAVVRVKRHLNEEPLDTLVLACKRRKTEEDHVTSIFKFAATLASQDENISKHISKAFSSTESQSSYKIPNLTNITEKLRTKQKLLSQNNRLKIVNCFRALNEEDVLTESDGASGSGKSLTIVEIESLPSDQGTSTVDRLEAESEAENYVYDIYYAPDCDLDDKMLDNPMSCHSLYDLVCEDYSVESYQVEEDSDDSNDENNWRNDYPDEDPDSINEDDMELACGFNGLKLNESNSLSSDEGEDALVYGIDEPDCAFDIGSDDEDCFGKDYAAYKKRVRKHLDSEASEKSDFCYGESDVDSDSS